MKMYTWRSNTCLQELKLFKSKTESWNNFRFKYQPQLAFNHINKTSLHRKKLTFSKIKGKTFINYQVKVSEKINNRDFFNVFKTGAMETDRSEEGEG